MNNDTPADVETLQLFLADLQRQSKIVSLEALWLQRVNEMLGRYKAVLTERDARVPEEYEPQLSPLRPGMGPGERQLLDALGKDRELEIDETRGSN